MAVNLTQQQKAEINELLSSGVPIENILGIEDFSDVLESEILNQLAALDEPVFTNPTTGKAASSVFAVFDALDYPRRR